ncbi:hypothetical protein VAR608DRAFT_4203 [Variovorax sp. HW608]|nr:hypothetical protein VAR608DRAFT_4203 [Variovorax sp. HW608]
MGEGWLFARASRLRRTPAATTPARPPSARSALHAHLRAGTEWPPTKSQAPFSRALAASRPVLPKAEGLEASAFMDRLLELDRLRGKGSASSAKRHEPPGRSEGEYRSAAARRYSDELLDWLGAKLFGRMRMHRELFRPQWLAAGNGEHYDTRFRPLDPTRDALFACRVEGDELVAVVERRARRAGSRVATRTVRFPLRFLADEGENRMWSEASQRLRRLRVEREEAIARFDEVETQVQALLARYSTAVA